MDFDFLAASDAASLPAVGCASLPALGLTLASRAAAVNPGLKILGMAEGARLWEPRNSERTEMARLIADRGASGYEELWRWSVEDLEGFWGALWERFGVQASRPYETVLASREMPGADWFPGARLNYAEHVLRMARPGAPAIVHAGEDRAPAEVTWDELSDQVARCAAGLRRLGVGRGDRVVAYLPNAPETVVALLATASIGAVWSSCAPEFGVPTVVDRFAQIEPKVLLATDGYSYGGKRLRPPRAGLARSLRRSRRSSTP